MAYYNDNRIGRRGKAAKRLLDCFEESTKRCEAARRYNRQAYDGHQEQEEES